MYATTAIRFTDPFASQDHHYNNQQTFRVDSPSCYSDRGATSPSAMSGGIPHTSKLYTQQTSRQHEDDYSSTLSGRGPPASYVTRHAGYTGTATQAASRTISPVLGAKQVTFDDPVSHVQSRRGSQANAIAPSFQIPKSVNSSGGSLSELAAQITCLFWFESAEVLQLVENSSGTAHISRQLVPDSKPTTGFRKWVTTILSTTLVAQNVVILALLFIYRLKKLNPTVRGKPGSEYRLLTVALMLGNKFLDDNTYTNKTWADVSGIIVGEIHIMEVEFLSNMRYTLFASSEDWVEWQTLLGRFSSFYDNSSRPPPPAPILPPASTLYLPMALPSPPTSNYASPPFGAVSFAASSYGMQPRSGPTPAPSPMAPLPVVQDSRKRSREDHATEPPAKRIASTYQGYSLSQQPAVAGSQSTSNYSTSRPTLPELSIPPIAGSASFYSQMPTQSSQLPPLKDMPSRAMAMVYPNTSQQARLPQLPAPTGFQYQPPPAPRSFATASRQHSPLPGSGATTPSSSMPHGVPLLHPPAQISPTAILQQRNSPYRPIRNVSTLLYPPPSGALQQKTQSVEHDQMYYQALAKPSRDRQAGHLPYIAQNMWLSGQDQQQAMTPVHQWPGFAHHQQHFHPHPLSQH